MTPHPPEFPAEWESSPQGMLGPDGRQPAAGWPGPALPPHALAGPAAEGYPGNRHPAGSFPGSGYDSGYPANEHLSDYPSMPGYPPLSDYPSMPGYPPAPDHWPGPGQPAGSHVDHDEYIHPGDYVHPGDPAAPLAMAGPAVAQPAAGGPATGALPVRTPFVPVLPGPEPVPAPPRQQPLVHEPDLHGPGLHGPGLHEPGLLEPDEWEPAPGRAGAPASAARPRIRPAGSEDAHWAMLAYLTVPIFGCLVPLAIYLLSLRGSRWLRAHVAQALNVCLTWLLYNVSALIVGGLLGLDSPRVALMMVLPVLATLWLIILVYLIRAARLASRGREYTLPRWLCSQIIR